MKRTTFGAIVITVCWLAGVGLLIAFNWQSFKGMEPNAWGDFLAGSVASPLALIWLVASYMQQGDDLKLNTKALMLQQKELARQAEETRKLAEHAESQAKASLAIAKMTEEDREKKEARFLQGQAPDLDFELYDWLERLCCKVTNHGGDIFDVRFIHEKFGELEFDTDKLRRGQFGQLDVNCINPSQDVIHVQFQTHAGANCAASFIVEDGIVKKSNV